MASPRDSKAAGTTLSRRHLKPLTILTGLPYPPLQRQQYQYIARLREPKPFKEGANPDPTGQLALAEAYNFTVRLPQRPPSPRKYRKRVIDKRHCPYCQSEFAQDWSVGAKVHHVRNCQKLAKEAGFLTTHLHKRYHATQHTVQSAIPQANLGGARIFGRVIDSGTSHQPGFHLPSVQDQHQAAQHTVQLSTSSSPTGSSERRDISLQADSDVEGVLAYPPGSRPENSLDQATQHTIQSVACQAKLGEATTFGNLINPAPSHPLPSHPSPSHPPTSQHHQHQAAQHTVQSSIPASHQRGTFLQDQAEQYTVHPSIAFHQHSIATFSKKVTPRTSIQALDHPAQLQQGRSPTVQSSHPALHSQPAPQNYSLAVAPSSDEGTTSSKSFQSFFPTSNPIFRSVSASHQVDPTESPCSPLPAHTDSQHSPPSPPAKSVEPIIQQPSPRFSSRNSDHQTFRENADMDDSNTTQRSGGRGSARGSTPRQSSLLNPSTPSRRPHEGSYIHPDAFTSAQLQWHIINYPGINPYTNQEDPYWGRAQLRAQLGASIWEGIITMQSTLSAAETIFLRGLAYAYSSSAERGRRRFEEMLESHRQNQGSRDNRRSTANNDPFIDQNGEELEVVGSGHQAFNAFDAQSDYCERSEYGQQAAYQQQAGYGQTVVYDLPVTSNTRLPSRLPLQAVRGTQGDALHREIRAPSARFPQQSSLSMDDYQNLSPQMQSAFIDVQGLASPRGHANFGSAATRIQPRDAAPYTGFAFARREMSEETESTQPTSPTSARTVIRDSARQSTNQTSSIDSGPNMGAQPGQQYTGQPNTAMATARAAQPLRQMNAAQFMAMSAAQRNPTGRYPRVNNMALSNDVRNEVLDIIGRDENGRPLNYDEPRRSVLPHQPDLSHGQGYPTSIMSEESQEDADRQKSTREWLANTSVTIEEPKEEMGPLKSAVEWWEKSAEQEKISALFKRMDMKEPEQNFSSSTRRELDEDSEPLPADFSTPTKADDQESYTSPIGTGRPPTDGSTRAYPAQAATMVGLQHLIDYKDVAEANGSDGFTRFGQPPAHAIDHSADGNKSMFDKEWQQPPQRIGRDPRHQTTMHEGRPTLFMDPPSASGSGGRGGRPF